MFAPHHPIDHQGAPTRFRPSWYVPQLVYQSGVPNLPHASLTGGGFLPQKNLYGRQAPGWQPYVQPVTSGVGGGSFPSRPNFLTRLLGAGWMRGVI